MSLEIQIKTLSPICLSGGLSFGAGEADTQTDLDGYLPIFRGRTLKGLLSEEIAALLPVLERDPGPWHDAAVELFGRSGLSTNAAIGFGNGALHAAYHEAAKQWKNLVSETLTVTRQQTQIEDHTGAPKKGSLRSSKLARAGLVFHFSLREGRPISDRALFLLAAATASLKRAGLHRNRGWGEIEASLWLDNVDRTQTLLPGLQGGKLNIHRSKPAASQAKSLKASVLQLDITLNSPAVLAKSGAEPSTVESHDFLPGTSILGALASRWLASNRVKDAAGDPTFRKLFLDGTTRYLNAYPQHGNRRYLPVPKTWLHEKYKETPLKDLAADGVTPSLDDKALGSGFVWIERDEDEGTRITLCTTEVKTFLHHKRDRSLGRATKDSGDLYSYQAITAGQSFRSYVLCEDESLSGVVAELFQRGPLSLGRSRSASYGGNPTVKVKALSEDWSEFPLPQELEDFEHLSVTLLSDYIGERHGVADAGVLIEEIKSHLNISSEVKVSKFLASGQAGGYVGAWKMPRPTSATLAAGSVLVFHQAPSDLDQKLLRQLERSGLGARRAEGFGRLAFCWHGDEGESLQCEPARVGEVASSNGEGREFLSVKQQIIGHVLEKELRLAGFDQAKLVRGRVPSSSLLGRVRMRVRTATDAGEFLEFLEGVGHRKDHKGELTQRLKEAGKSLLNCRIDRQDMWTWLSDWASGSRSWPVDVTAALRRASLPEDAHLGDWKFVKIFLDAFFESLRRRRKGDGTQ